MPSLTALLIALLAVQQPPPINYTLPGQVTAAPPAIPADAEVLPFEAAAVVERPSAAARHHLLASAPRIPARGIAFTARCLLDRANGRVILCRDANVPAAYSAAALALGSLYQFRLTPVQMVARGALVVTIQDRIVPADVRPAARLFTFTARPPGNVTYAQVMTGEQSQAYYPPAALQINYDARVRLDCQVQPDLSLFCINPAVAPGNRPTRFEAEFQLAALQLSGSFRVGATLSNNAPAAGTIFRTTIAFRVPAE